jgi:hypothetical protein
MEFIKMFFLKISYKFFIEMVGGAMFRTIITWLYPESQVIEQINISVRNLLYYFGDSVSIASIYVDINNNTIYPIIDILPSMIDVNGVIFCQSRFATIKKGKLGIEFKSILTKEQVEKLLQFKKQQEENKGRGVLRINGYMVLYCGNEKRMIKKLIFAENVNLEGI